MIDALGGFGRSGKPTWKYLVPSNFAPGSIFSRDAAGGMRVATDSFNYDTCLEVRTANRAIGIAGATIADSVAVFSRNTGVNANRLPDTFELGPTANGWKLALGLPDNAAAIMDWQRSASPGGKAPMRLGLIVPLTTTKATLATFSHPNWVGSFAFCSDASGVTGPCMVYCTSQGVWRRDAGTGFNTAL